MISVDELITNQRLMFHEQCVVVDHPSHVHVWGECIPMVSIQNQLFVHF